MQWLEGWEEQRLERLSLIAGSAGRAAELMLHVGATCGTQVFNSQGDARKLLAKPPRLQPAFCQCPCACPQQCRE